MIRYKNEKHRSRFLYVLLLIVIVFLSSLTTYTVTYRLALQSVLSRSSKITDVINPNNMLVIIDVKVESKINTSSEDLLSNYYIFTIVFKNNINYEITLENLYFIYNNTNGFQVINMSDKLPISIKPSSYYNISLFVRDHGLYKIEHRIVHDIYMLNPNDQINYLLKHYIGKEQYLIKYSYRLFNISVVKEIDLIKYVKKYLYGKYFRNHYVFQNHVAGTRVEAIPICKNNTLVIVVEGANIYNPGNDPYVFIGYKIILEFELKPNFGMFIILVKRTKEIVIAPKQEKTINLRVYVNLTRYGINLTELYRKGIGCGVEVFLIPNDNYNFLFKLVREFYTWENFAKKTPDD